MTLPHVHSHSFHCENFTFFFATAMKAKHFPIRLTHISNVYPAYATPILLHNARYDENTPLLDRSQLAVCQRTLLHHAHAQIADTLIHIFVRFILCSAKIFIAKVIT